MMRSEKTAYISVQVIAILLIIIFSVMFIVAVHFMGDWNQEVDRASTASLPQGVAYQLLHNILISPAQGYEVVDAVIAEPTIADLFFYGVATKSIVAEFDKILAPMTPKDKELIYVLWLDGEAITEDADAVQDECYERFYSHDWRIDFTNLLVGANKLYYDQSAEITIATKEGPAVLLFEYCYKEAGS